MGRHPALDFLEESKGLFAAWRLDELPEALRRDGLRHYYLSVYPSIREMPVWPQNGYPCYPPTVTSLYIHIPFCSGACSFCSYFFKSVTRAEEAQLDSYVELLLEELRLHARHVPVKPQYLYIGGGTPSLLSAGSYERLLGTLREMGSIDPGLMATVEVHPELFEDEERAENFLETLQRNGVGRISVGLQDSSPLALRVFNRRHDLGFLELLFRITRRRGIYVNLDLMYGLPGQSLEDWCRSLDLALNWSPDSISTYFTFVDPGTRLFRQVADGELEIPQFEHVHLQRILAQLALEEEGYRELPNDFWWKWDGDPGDFVASLPSNSHTLPLGPGSYGYLGGAQFANYFSFAHYKTCLAQGRRPIWRGLRLTEPQALRRDVMFSLKNAPYLDPGLFAARFQVDLGEVFGAELERLHDLDLLAWRDGKIYVTRKGSLCVEEMASLFRDPEIQPSEDPRLRRFNFGATYGTHAK